VARLDQAISEAVPDWSLAAIVPALTAMRGIDLVSAVTILAEIGDLARFESPPADGVSGPCAFRALDGREHQARRHHQGRQWAHPARVGRSCLGLAPPPHECWLTRYDRRARSFSTDRL
jgi:hypothetical protein